jgi:hypothetical protein
MDKRNQYVPPTEENLERAFKADPPISNQPPEDEVKARLALKVSDPEVAERLRADGYEVQISEPSEVPDVGREALAERVVNPVFPPLLTPGEHVDQADASLQKEQEILDGIDVATVDPVALAKVRVEIAGLRLQMAMSLSDPRMRRGLRR